MSKRGEWKRKLKENAMAASHRKKRVLELKEVPEENVLKDMSNWLNNMIPRPVARKEVCGTGMSSFNKSPGTNSEDLRNQRKERRLAESNDARPHSGNNNDIDLESIHYSSEVKSIEADLYVKNYQEVNLNTLDRENERNLASKNSKFGSKDEGCDVHVIQPCGTEQEHTLPISPCQSIQGPPKLVKEDSFEESVALSPPTEEIPDIPCLLDRENEGNLVAKNSMFGSTEENLDVHVIQPCDDSFSQQEHTLPIPVAAPSSYDIPVAFPSSDGIPVVALLSHDIPVAFTSEGIPVGSQSSNGSKEENFDVHCGDSFSEQEHTLPISPCQSLQGPPELIKEDSFKKSAPLSPSTEEISDIPCLSNRENEGNLVSKKSKFGSKEEGPEVHVIQPCGDSLSKQEQTLPISPCQSLLGHPELVKEDSFDESAPLCPPTEEIPDIPCLTNGSESKSYSDGLNESSVYNVEIAVADPVLHSNVENTHGTRQCSSSQNFNKSLLPEDSSKLVASPGKSPLKDSHRILTPKKNFLKRYLSIQHANERTPEKDGSSSNDLDECVKIPSNLPENEVILGQECEKNCNNGTTAEFVYGNKDYIVFVGSINQRFWSKENLKTYFFLSPNDKALSFRFSVNATFADIKRDLVKRWTFKFHDMVITYLGKEVAPEDEILGYEQYAAFIVFDECIDNRYLHSGSHSGK